MERSAFEFLMKKEVFIFNKAETFTEDKMIYSESKWYPKPIVAMPRAGICRYSAQMRFRWNILYLILLGPFIVASIILLVRAMERAGSRDEKSRLRYILAVVIIGVFTGLSDLVQILQVPIPPLGHFGCLVYSTILGVAVFKHQEDFDLFAQMRMKLDDLSQMTAAIAHEIRNPLSSIKAASDLMAKELQGSQPYDMSRILNPHH